MCEKKDRGALLLRGCARRGTRLSGKDTLPELLAGGDGDEEHRRADGQWNQRVAGVRHVSRDFSHGVRSGGLSRSAVTSRDQRGEHDRQAAQPDVCFLHSDLSNSRRIAGGETLGVPRAEKSMPEIREDVKPWPTARYRERPRKGEKHRSRWLRVWLRFSAMPLAGMTRKSPGRFRDSRGRLALSAGSATRSR